MQIDQFTAALQTDIYEVEMPPRGLFLFRSAPAIIFIIVGCMAIFPTKVLAQSATSGATYKSEIDELLSIRTISILPFSDNAEGIYARPLESHLTDVVGKMHRWDLRPVNTVGPVLSPEELEEDSAKARTMAGGVSADAFLAGRISKGPNGITIVLSLFLTKDAKLLAKGTLKDSRIFDLAELKKEMEALLGKITTQLPYQGNVLSRDGQRVTVNLGSKDGIQPKQILSVIQIISATRHPKFNFLISSEKEIIGRVKILKVDETLSFGIVLSEKEKNAVQKGGKIAGLDFVQYPNAESLDDPSGGKDVKGRPDAPVAFGDNPSPWLPRRNPTFGLVSARLGDSLFSESVNVSGVGTLSSSSYLAPSIFLDGELWVTSSLTVHAGFKQGIIPVDNPRAGSSPNRLNQSLTRYELLFGYSYRFGENVWGPSVEALLGYMSYRLFVDDSTPTAYTTMNYTGFKAGISGYFPISADKRWAAGAEAFLVLKNSLKERPVSSGASADNTINMFGIFGHYKLRENLKAIGKLEFEQYATNFSGTGSRGETVTTSSQRLTTLSAGIAYLF